MFTVYALLDSPSITGAYKFTIHCQDTQVIMDVENHLYARKDIKQLGIAPMTSMFSCGNNERRMCDTIHPQIHDSDRLSMWLGNGEWVCRPLNNPQKLQFNAFQDKNPRGFGLLQLDRDFSHYQDVMGWYNKRPSLWVLSLIHISEPTRLGMISYAVFCLKKKNIEMKGRSDISK